MRDPRLVRFLGPKSALRYALLRWRADHAAWFVEEFHDDLSELDALADALEAEQPGEHFSTLGLESMNRRDLRRLKTGPLPADLARQIRPPRSARH